MFKRYGEKGGGVEEYLHLVTCVYIKKCCGSSWKNVEEVPVVGLIKDFSRALAHFCRAVQSHEAEHTDQFYSPPIEHINEILDKFSIDLYKYNIANDDFNNNDLKKTRNEKKQLVKQENVVNT